MTVEWRDQSHVTFDNVKDKLISFMSRRNPELKRKISEARVMVRGHIIKIGKEVTRWWFVYLDTGLMSRVY